MTTETPAAEQLPLIPERLPTLGGLQDVQLDHLPHNQDLDGPPPSAQLVESIRRWGVLEPVLVRAVGGSLNHGDPATLISGRRRIKAVRLLRDEYREKVRKFSEAHPGEVLTEERIPGYRAAYERLRDFQRVPVRVVSDPEGVLNDGRTEALLVATNAVRTDNPQADFQALARLLDRLTADGLSEKACLTEASRVTGLAVGTVKQRLRLLHLTPELQDDFLAGRLGYTVALHASRLDPESQGVLARKLDAGERATLDLVKDAKREAVRAVQVGLFDGLPDATDAPQDPRGAPGPAPDARGLAERAHLMIEQLRAVKLPIMQEAASLMADLLADVEGRDALAYANVDPDAPTAGIPPNLVLDIEPEPAPEKPKRTRRKKVTE